MSVLLNIPKFLESKFVWNPINIPMNASMPGMLNSTNQTDLLPNDVILVNDLPVDGEPSLASLDYNFTGEIEYELSFDVTELRSDPDYIRFYINWTRLFTTGVIPMAALIYLNFNIFRGIQVGLNWKKNYCCFINIFDY